MMKSFLGTRHSITAAQVLGVKSILKDGKTWTASAEKQRLVDGLVA